MAIQTLMWQKNLEFQGYLMKTRRRQENSQHRKLRDCARCLVEDLTICSRQRKGDENMHFNTIVAPNVKRIINARGLKQSAVAKRAGYSEQQFSAIVNGRKIAKDVDVLRIANALGVDVTELYMKGAGDI